MLRAKHLGQSFDTDCKSFNLQLVAIRGQSLSLFGVSRIGSSVCVHLDEFAPSLLLVPIDPAFDELDELEEETRTALDGESPVIEDMTWEAQVKAIFFSKNQKHAVIRVTCASVQAFFMARKHFKKKNNKVFHVCDDYAPVLQLFHQAPTLSYQSWIDLSNATPVTRKRTTCNFEYRVKNVLSLHLAPDQSPQPKILKCYYAIQAVSRDGALQSKPLHPNPDRLCDRVITARLGFAWTGESKMFHTETHSLLPSSDSSIIHHDSEVDLLQAVRDVIVNFDPDDLVFYPDHIDPFVYTYKRAMVLKSVERCCGWERLIGNAPSMFRDRFQTRTREMLNCMNAIRKKVTVRVESAALDIVSAHKDLRATPLKTPLPSRYAVNTWVRSGEYDRCHQLLATEIDLIFGLENDNSLHVEFASISRIVYTPLTDTVSRGEQIRVWNALSMIWQRQSKFVNRYDLRNGPLKFSSKLWPPTFQDPPEPERAVRLREECFRDLEAKKKYWDRNNRIAAFVESMAKAEQAAEAEKAMAKADKKAKIEAEGGNVLKPLAAFYDEHVRVGILDFASLYPSIIMGYNISFDTVIQNVNFLHDPEVNYIVASINASETVAIVQNYPGVMPELLKTLVSERRRVKKRMEDETGFQKTCSNKQQEALKVCCNAAYGFFGAEKRGSILGMKPLMFVVTSLGRYLQKQAVRYLYDTYRSGPKNEGIISIYGDTDSFFVRLEVDEPHPQYFESQVAAIGKKFKMGEAFNWDYVVNHYKTRGPKPPPLDITTFSLQHKLNAVLYLIFSKLAEEICHENHYPSSVGLEFENLSSSIWLGNVKKCYMYEMWNPSNPSQIQKMKITGMPTIKREYCPFTRNVLYKLSEMLLKREAPDRIKAFILESMENLGRAPISQLQISKNFKGKAFYKTWTQTHLQIVLKLEAEHRKPVTPNERVYFVMTKGRAKKFMRSELPSKVDVSDIDYQYYMEDQFYRPVAKVLQFTPEIMHFDLLFYEALQRVVCKAKHILSVFDSDDAEPLTLEDLNKRRKVM